MTKTNINIEVNVNKIIQIKMFSWTKNIKNCKES